MTDDRKEHSRSPTRIMTIHRYLLIVLCTLVLVNATAFVPLCNHQATSSSTERFAKQQKLSKADEERLLLSEPALTAFIAAEMRDFLTSKTKEEGRRLTMWELSEKEL